jgi:two-component system OmpR family response regulator
MNTQPLVLVADDEPRITRLVAMSLADDGFNVVSALGGEEALRKAEESKPDIVLLDIVMPDIDGFEVMRRLRETRPVPVILLTAKGSSADRARGLDLGADDYLASRSIRTSSPRVRAVHVAPQASPAAPPPSWWTTSRSTSSAGPSRGVARPCR